MQIVNPSKLSCEFYYRYLINKKSSNYLKVHTMYYILKSKTPCKIKAIKVRKKDYSMLFYV